MRNDGLSAIELAPSKKKLGICNTASIKADMKESRFESAVRSLFTEHGFSRRAIVAVSPPDDQVFFAQVVTAIPNLQQIRSVLKSLIEDSVPIDFDNIIADVSDASLGVSSQAQQEIPVAAISKLKLEKIMQAFDSVKVKPDIITPAPSTLDAAISYLAGDLDITNFTALHVDPNRCCAAYYKNGAKAMLRTMPTFTRSFTDSSSITNLKRDLELGKRRVFGTLGGQKSPLIANVPRQIYESAGFDVLNENLKHISVFDAIAGGEELDPEFFLPAALAFFALGGNRPNFVDSFKEEEKAGEKPVALLALSAVLLIAIIGVGVGRLYIDNRRLENVNEKMDRAIRESLEMVIPNMPDVIDPAHELELALQDLQERYQGLTAAVGKQISPVSLINIFNRNVPREFDVELDRIQARPDSLIITGTAGSFSRAEQLQRIMAEVDYFANVEVNLSSRAGTAQVGFVMSIDINRDI